MLSEALPHRCLSNIRSVKPHRLTLNVGMHAPRLHV